MRFQSLRAEQFRNLHDIRLTFCGELNVFVGNNGQGKTSLLEALYLLAGFRSFRGAKNRDLIQSGAQTGRIVAEVEADGVERTIQIDLKPGGKKYLVDGKEPGALSEWVGKLLVVTFSPDDLYLVKGEPELRRRWLDRLIFLLQPTHLSNVVAYQKALKSRNALLKDGMYGRDLMLLDSFDETLARLGIAVGQARAKWLQSIGVLVGEQVRDITGGVHSAGASYDTEVHEPSVEALLDTMIARRPEDVRRRTTSYGVHRDDIALTFSDHDARRFASQGEQRALTLALKLAETRLLMRERQTAPVLLLDDVAGELDAERNRLLYEQLEVARGQVFMAGTEPPKAATKSTVERRNFTVNAGRIFEEKQTLTVSPEGLLPS